MSPAPHRRPLTVDRLLDAIVELDRGMGVEQDEPTLVAHFVKALARIVGGTWRGEVHEARPGAPSPAAGSIPVVVDGATVATLTRRTRAKLAPAAAARATALVQLLVQAIRNHRRARDLRFIRAQIAHAVDHAHALIFMVDARGRVLVFNRALVELTGYSAQEVLDRDLWPWIAESDRAALERQIERAIAGRAVTAHEVLLRCKDGRAVSTIFNLSRPAEHSPQALAIGQDVTPVRLLEHQVLQAEKLASLGQLAAGVVHEINNPLTSISVYAEYLLKKAKAGGGDASDAAMLEKIVAGSNRILKFMRDLVNYGKPSGEQLDVVSLNEVVQQSISFCEHVIERSGATLEVSLAADLRPLSGVKDQLLQVLINLITNACQALQTGAEGPRRLAIRTWDAGDERVALEVRDTGCGIARPHLPLVFEPFFTTKAPGEGTGLGLSIVKRIVDSHNGSVMVESRPGHGTIFRVTLPAGATRSA